AGPAAAPGKPVAVIHWRRSRRGVPARRKAAAAVARAGEPAAAERHLDQLERAAVRPWCIAGKRRDSGRGAGAAHQPAWFCRAAETGGEDVNHIEYAGNDTAESGGHAVCTLTGAARGGWPSAPKLPGSDECSPRI